MVLTILLLAILVSAAAMVVLMFAVGREPAIPPDSFLVVRVEGDLADSASDTVFAAVVGARRNGTRAITENLRKAKADRRIAGVIVRPSGISTAYWARLQEVRDAIVDFKSSGKPIVAHLEYGGDREYFVASACSRVFLLPTSPLDVSGFATYELFLRGTLDKIGAYPDFLHIGDYKTAPNQLTEKTFTPAHREMSESLNRDLFEQFIQAVAEGRKKTPAEVRQLVDDGPFLAEDAVRAGLVDDVAYDDQLDAKIKPGAASVVRVKDDDYAKVSFASVGLAGRSRIAVINASGVINSGRSGIDPLNGAVVGSDTLVEYIRKAGKDRSIKAIVLHVDSPGGSTVASDVIWRELMQVRTGPGARPLVASMSDLAASGGYYIAMAAPDIVAEPGTLTGSIGIYGGKIVTGGTYDKLGMNVEADQHRPACRDELSGAAVQRGGPRQARRATAGVLRSVRREGGRLAAQEARRDRCDCAGAGLDRPAGERPRPGGRARRPRQGGGDREGTREDSRRRTGGARGLPAEAEPLRSLHDVALRDGRAGATGGPARHPGPAGGRDADRPDPPLPSGRTAGADAVGYVR